MDKDFIITILIENENEVDNHNDAVFNSDYGKVADAILAKHRQKVGEAYTKGFNQGYYDPDFECDD